MRRPCGAAQARRSGSPTSAVCWPRTGARADAWPPASPRWPRCRHSACSRSEFLIVDRDDARRCRWLSLPLGIGLVSGRLGDDHAAAGALPRGARRRTVDPAPHVLALAPVWLQLVLVLVLGLAMPAVVTDWMRGSRARAMTAAAIIRAGPAEPCRPWPRHVLSTRQRGRALAGALASDAGSRLLALWADTGAGARAVPRSKRGRRAAGLQRRSTEAAIPRCRPAARRRVVRADDPRPVGPRGGRRARPAPLAGSWPLGPRSAVALRPVRRRAAPGAAGIPARRGRGSAPDPGRADPCRHHRARAFPLHRPGRDGGAAGSRGSATRTRAARADARQVRRASPPASPPGCPAIRPSRMPMAFAQRRRGGAATEAPPPRARAARA